MGVLEAFFDAIIPLLVGIATLGTVFVVLFESWYLKQTLSDEQKSIIWKSGSFGILFIWAFARRVIDLGWLESRGVLWTIRVFLLYGSVYYLRVLVKTFLERHGDEIEFMAKLRWIQFRRIVRWH